MGSKQIALGLRNTLPVWGVIAIAFAAAGSSASKLSVSGPQQANLPADETQTYQRLTDATERQGPISIGDRQYTVVLKKKALQANGSSEVTLAGLEILDARGRGLYRETFPYAIANGRFSRLLTASASVLSGTRGAALVIRFIEQPAVPTAETAPAKESWQVFGIVNGQFTTFGAVLPLGQGTGITVGGVVTGVMVRGGIAVVPLASAAEELGFRAWVGNFYVFVPVRVDWAHGEWGEGEQCYELSSGTLRAKGCRMRVEAVRKPQQGTPGEDSVRLYTIPDGNVYNSQVVAVRPESEVNFLAVIALVHWKASGQRVECNFDDVWLETRIDGEQGWVRGEEAFGALGLPQGNPE